MMPAVTVHDRGSSIAVVGEVDASTAHQITAAVDARLAEAAVPVRIDLRETLFCDSAGLVTLLDCRAEVARRGSRLVLVAPSEAVVRLLDLTGLTDSFDIEP